MNDVVDSWGGTGKEFKSGEGLGAAKAIGKRSLVPFRFFYKRGILNREIWLPAKKSGNEAFESVGRGRQEGAKRK